MREGGERHGFAPDPSLALPRRWRGEHAALRPSARPITESMARVAAGPEIERLIQLLARLPGLGPRSARRAALALVKKKEQLLSPLAAALAETRDTILTCEICGNIDTRSPCTLCRDRRARPLAHLRGRGGRRSLGARARRRAQRALSRARRHAVAARRHRPRGSEHRQADRAGARSCKSKRCCSL